MHTETLRKAATAVGRGLAAELDLPLRCAFADDLAGDVARFRVLRRLRKLFPKLDPEVLNEVIEEVLTP